MNTQEIKCPTKNQIITASATSKVAYKTLSTLFPEVFIPPIQAGQIYSWGTDSNGGSGLVINNPVGLGYSFINFHKGFTYIPLLDNDCTKDDLKEKLNNINGFNQKTLHNCYNGNLRGPKYFKSWCTK
jgi:hypothetical protein